MTQSQNFSAIGPMEVPKWIAVLLLVPEALEMRPKMAPEGHVLDFCVPSPVEISALFHSNPVAYRCPSFAGDRPDCSPLSWLSARIRYFRSFSGPKSCGPRFTGSYRGQMKSRMRVMLASSVAYRRARPRAPSVSACQDPTARATLSMSSVSRVDKPCQN